MSIRVEVRKIISIRVEDIQISSSVDIYTVCMLVFQEDVEIVLQRDYTNCCTIKTHFLGKV